MEYEKFRYSSTSNPFPLDIATYPLLGFPLVELGVWGPMLHSGLAYMILLI